MATQTLSGDQPLPPKPTDAGPRRVGAELEDPDREETLEAARQEIPSGVIKPAAWNSRVRRLRPRFVAATVLVTVSSLIMLAVGFSAAFTTVPGIALVGVGLTAIVGTLALLAATWSEDRVAALPRIALGGTAAVGFIVVAVWALSL